MSDYTGLAELQTKAEAILLSLPAVLEQFDRLSGYTKSSVSGAFVIDMVRSLAPASLRMVQERVVSRECQENGRVLSDVEFNGQGAVLGKLSDDVSCVINGYIELIGTKLGDVLEGMKNNESKGRFLADVARLGKLACMYNGGGEQIDVHDFSQIVPCDYEDGGYLMDLTPLDTAKEHLNAIRGWYSLYPTNAWNLDGCLNNVKFSINIVQLIFKHFEGYNCK